MRVCILGDTGLLGQAFVNQLAGEEREEILGISSSKFRGSRFWKPLRGRYLHRVIDLLQNKKQFLNEVRKFKPQVLINCAALAGLEECERQPELAKRLNAELPGALAELADREGFDFVHFSSDQVFDGLKGRPYEEEDPPHPLNWYGVTKQLGEAKILRVNPQALIVRTNIVGFRDRDGTPPFAEWLCRSLTERQEITLFEDYVTSPIHVRDLSRLVWKTYKKRLSGILHLAARDAASKYQLGQQLAVLAGLDFSKVRRGRLKDSVLVSTRPPYLALDVSRAEKELGFTFPTVHHTVRNLAEDFKFRLEGADHATISDRFFPDPQN